MKRKTYKKMAFQLFEELSGVYAEDIVRHADLCRRYPIIAHKYLQWLEKSIKDVKVPYEVTTAESKEQMWQRLQERINGFDKNGI